MKKIHVARTRFKGSGRLVTRATVAPSLDRLRRLAAAGKKIRPRDLGRLLLAITTYTALGVPVPAHFIDGPLVAIPLDVAKLISKELISGDEWSAAQKAAKAAVTNPRDQRLRQAADDYRRRNPRLTDGQIAKKIRDDPALRATITIRRKGKLHRMSLNYLRQLIAN